MAYDIHLTYKEWDALGWATDRGYFPEESYDGLEDVDEDSLGPLSEEPSTTAHRFTLSETDAWYISMAREEDAHALYNCLGGDLLDKLVALENSIV